MKLEDVLAAYSRIKKNVRKTPLLTSRLINERLGCEVYFKSEHLQTTGSFKARGALNFLLTEHSGSKSFTTYSSGNHGQALSWACTRIGAKAVVFVPEDASRAKVSAIEQYGGIVRRAGHWPHERLEACLAYAEANQATIVPPFEDERIIAGQGTVLLEVLEDLPVFDALLVPGGGGGLLSGTSLVCKTLRPKTTVFSCESQSANDIALSLQAGKPVAIDPPKTIADGIRHLKPGSLTWPVFSQYVDEGLTCQEETIRAAMALVARHMKQIFEPTGAVSLACLMDNPKRFQGQTVVLIVSGGNVDLEDYCRLVL
ncbi:MAG: threonine/serine dehydratase [Acidobacteria bacterium]|nr:threonine/serine dehydratase [Acidobacteriota bacterium]MCB9398830.1 threonine/serine dehydratase [Acidobacteriota bacterium]